MILEIAKQRYKNTGDELKRFHWWEAVRYQPRWRARSDAPSTMDTVVSSSEAAIKEDVTHLISRDRAKTAAQKGKEKEDSSSQSESFFTISAIMSTLKKLCTSFTRSQMCKHYNKLREANTSDLDAEELVSHREALRLIKNDLNFAT
jgi:hypothetical protein